MSLQVSIVIPYLDTPRYRLLLPECLQSIIRLNQTSECNDIHIVIDGPLDGVHSLPFLPVTAERNTVHFHRVGAHVGVAAAFNIGVASAKNHCILMMGCDDLVRPGLIKLLQDTYYSSGQVDAYYWLPVEYEDGSIRDLPSGHAMVTKTFWSNIGGYPLEAAIGACDAILLAALLSNCPEKVIRVPLLQGHPQMIVRRDPTTYTGSRDPRWNPIIERVKTLYSDIYGEREKGKKEKGGQHDGS